MMIDLNSRSPKSLEWRTRRFIKRWTGNYFRSVRLQLDLTQAQLSAVCGVSRKTISYVETGDDIRVDEDVFEAMCSGLHLDPSIVMTDLRYALASQLTLGRVELRPRKVG